MFYGGLLARLFLLAVTRKFLESTVVAWHITLHKMTMSSLVSYLYRLNKHKKTRKLMSFRGAGSWIMLPLERASLAVSPWFKSLC